METHHLEQATDLKAVSDLFRRAVGPHHRPSVGDDSRATGLVTIESGRVIAFAGWTPSHRPDWWGMEIVVEPDNSSLTVLQEMLSTAEDSIKNHGGGTIRLWVWQPQLLEAAQNHGFRRERRLDLLHRLLPVGEAPEYPQWAHLSRFRPGQDEDVWLDTYNAAFAGHPENGAWNRQVLAERMQKPWFKPRGMLMVWTDGNLAGSCWTKVHPQQTGEIYVIIIHPRWRRQGLGRALTLDGMLYLQDEEACREVILYADSDNEPALNLYRGLGYRLELTGQSLTRRV
jgi:mycothiol synthase